MTSGRPRPLDHPTPWSPLDGIPNRLYLEAVRDDDEGLRFLLRGAAPADRALRLSFDAPIAYRNINESYRLRTWGARKGEGPWPALSTLERSTWVDWLVAEAGGVIEADAVVHYAIYTPEDCVDVASAFPPLAEWL